MEIGAQLFTVRDYCQNLTDFEESENILIKNEVFYQNNEDELLKIAEEIPSYKV